jgi:hypothetical protein
MALGKKVEQAKKTRKCYLDGPDVVKGGRFQGVLVRLRHMQLGRASLPDTHMHSAHFPLSVPALSSSHGKKIHVLLLKEPQTHLQSG